MWSIFYSNFGKALILSKAEVSPGRKAGPLSGSWVGDSDVLWRRALADDCSCFQLRTDTLGTQHPICRLQTLALCCVHSPSNSHRS